jgi:6-phosphogluconolactonase
LLKVTPKTAPHQRISFSFAALVKSKDTFLHITGFSKKQVLATAVAGQESTEMPIRAFLQTPDVNTQVYWAE